jgi:pimeloyl-ACP methyl ester carboxylesterase
MNIGWGEWYPNIAELAKFFTVYAIDLPGCGNSSKLDFTSMDFERDFLEVVEKFIRHMKLKGVHIVGHSSGALIGLKLAQRKKVVIKRLVAVSPIGFTEEVPFIYKLLAFLPLARFLSVTAMKPTKKNMHEFLTSVMQNKQVTEQFVDYYFDSVIRLSHPFLLLNRFLDRFKLRQELLVKNGDVITNKTLIIVGDRDPNIRPLDISQVRTIVPHVVIKTFHNCGHVPSMEQNTLFDKKVIQFIS